MDESKYMEFTVTVSDLPVFTSVVCVGAMYFKVAAYDEIYKLLLPLRPYPDHPSTFFALYDDVLLAKLWVCAWFGMKYAWNDCNHAEEAIDEAFSTVFNLHDVVESYRGSEEDFEDFFQDVENCLPLHVGGTEGYTEPNYHISSDLPSAKHEYAYNLVKTINSWFREHGRNKFATIDALKREGSCFADFYGDDKIRKSFEDGQEYLEQLNQSGNISKDSLASMDEKAEDESKMDKLDAKTQVELSKSDTSTDKSGFGPFGHVNDDEIPF